MGTLFSIISLYIGYIEPTETFSLATMPRKVSYTPFILYSSSNAIFDVLLAIQGFLILLTTLAWWFLLFISQCLRQKY